MSAAERPDLRIVAGAPTPAELAALVAVLQADRVARPAGPDRLPWPASGWADRSATLRGELERGSGAWVASGRRPGVRTRASW